MNQHSREAKIEASPVLGERAEDWAGVVIGDMDVASILFAGGSREWAQLDIGDGDVATLLRQRRSPSVGGKRAKGSMQVESAGLGEQRPPTKNVGVASKTSTVRPNDDAEICKAQRQVEAHAAAASGPPDGAIRPPRPHLPPLASGGAGNIFEDGVFDILPFDATSASWTAVENTQAHMLHYLNQMDNYRQALLRIRMDFHDVVTSVGRVEYLESCLEKVSRNAEAQNVDNAERAGEGGGKPNPIDKAANRK